MNYIQLWLRWDKSLHIMLGFGYQFHYILISSILCNAQKRKEILGSISTLCIREFAFVSGANWSYSLLQGRSSIFNSRVHFCHVHRSGLHWYGYGDWLLWMSSLDNIKLQNSGMDGWSILQFTHFITLSTFEQRELIRKMTYLLLNDHVYRWQYFTHSSGTLDSWYQVFTWMFNGRIIHRSLKSYIYSIFAHSCKIT